MEVGIEGKNFTISVTHMYVIHVLFSTEIVDRRLLYNTKIDDLKTSLIPGSNICEVILFGYKPEVEAI
jgi:hypothetical protein